MASRTCLLRRFDELIDFGKSLPEFSGSWSLDQHATKRRWQTASIFLLEKTFGKDSEYCKSFNDALRWNNPQSHITYGLSVLSGAKEEIEKGFLFKIEHLVAVDFFNSVIDQAQYLFSARGHIDTGNYAAHGEFGKHDEKARAFWTYGTSVMVKSRTEGKGDLAR
jgi:hypothetical protein